MAETAKWTLIAYAAATMAMVGLIWIVQIVHYPLVSQVDHNSFRSYAMDYQRLTTYVVAPLMLLELVFCPGIVRLALGRCPYGLDLCL